MSQIDLQADDFAANGTLDPEELGQKPRSKELRPADVSEWGGRAPDPDYDAGSREVPDQGSAAQVSAIVTWKDFRIQIRENLMERLGSAMKNLANAARPGALTDPLALIQQVRDAIAGVWSKTERELIVNWDFEVQDQSGGTKSLLIEHFQKPDISHRLDTVPGMGAATGAAPASPDMKLSSKIVTSVTVQGRAREKLEIEIGKSGEGKDTDDRAKADLVVTSGKQILIQSSTRLTLEFSGFKEELEDSAQKLAKLGEAIANVVGAGLDAIKAAIEAWWNDEAAAPGASGASSGGDVMDAVSAALRSFIDYMMSNVERMLDRWTGHAQLATSSIVVTSLSESGARRLREQLALSAQQDAEQRIARLSTELERLQAAEVAVAADELRVMQPRRAFPGASKLAVSMAFAERLSRGDAKAVAALKRVSKQLRDSDAAGKRHLDESKRLEPVNGLGYATPRLNGM